MSSKLLAAVTENTEVRIYAIDATEMVKEAQKTHNLSPLSAVALGRVIAATAMIGRMAKNTKEKVSLQIKGSAEIKSIYAASDYLGNVKAYISNPHVETVLNAKGKFDIGGKVGRDGSITVIRDLGLKEPYVGQYELTTGEIAEDIAAYYAYSEQQPTVVSLGVHVNSDGEVDAAGGFFIQPLPNCSEESIVAIEKAMSDIPSFTKMLSDGMSLQEIAQRSVKDLKLGIMMDNTVALKCDCSKERMEKALASIGKKDLTEIIEEDGKAELHCHFCNTYYQFDKVELENILKEL